MIVGIGTDIIEIKRIERAVRNPSFTDKYFTEKENAYFESRKQNGATIAGNFAAKESVAKALGTGFRKFTLRDIEVLRDEQGRPYINLHNQAQKLQDEMGIEKLLVTISHCQTYAVAYVVAEGNREI